MGEFDCYKPALAMIGLQFIYAGFALFTRVALVQGMSPRVFVVYRQVIATLIMAPIACFRRRRNSGRISLGIRSFSLIFVTSLIGVTANQNAYFEGLYLASSTAASAMVNLIPAITFVMAAILGMEKVNIRSFRSSAKIIGTAVCVGGAISMALLKGPKLLNMELLPSKSIFGAGGDNWLLGCLSLFGSSCFWSFWVIMQVPVTACVPDHIYSSTWMLFLAMIQSAIFALLIENGPEAWYLHSVEEFGCCLYAGIGSAVTFFVQTWCISQRGPLFSAMFNPLCTVITTIIASVFLQEELYTGSLLGAFAVIIGLYVVLWGKAEDLKEIKQEAVPKLQHDQEKMGQVLINESSEKKNSKVDLEEPLLS
ncbi:WAT1-related protein At4g30420-like isoform X1 [Quercus lobata]|uniref:WAT1-related protein n=1 Tax=Quercus lobata TaxID=97700 RepID=A0A7N2L1R7_QUELO|nr:WAT1-related protein At4g30420-like isoform X1 [Quercus lobata]